MHADVIAVHLPLPQQQCFKNPVSVSRRACQCLYQAHQRHMWGAWHYRPIAISCIGHHVAHCARCAGSHGQRSHLEQSVDLLSSCVFPDLHRSNKTPARQMNTTALVILQLDCACLVMIRHDVPAKCAHACVCVGRGCYKWILSPLSVLL
jgi:hypothetical protein